MAYFGIIKPAAFLTGRNVVLSIVRACSTSSSIDTPLKYEKDPAPFFLRKDNRQLMKRLTRMNLEKVYARRPAPLVRLGRQFITAEEVERRNKDAKDRAYARLQMPPIVQVESDEIKVISEDPGISQFTEAKFVITDITPTVTDRDRTILVRNIDGSLQTAPPEMRKRMNQIYFPKEGRKYTAPLLFYEANLHYALEQGLYEHVLDRTILQFEPYEKEYHHVTSVVYDHINESGKFAALQSTRYFGGMSFYLAWHKIIDNLLVYYLGEGLFTDAVDIIALMYNLNDVAYDRYVLELIAVDAEKDKESKKEAEEAEKSRNIVFNAIGRSESRLALEDACLKFIEEYIQSSAVAQKSNVNSHFQAAKRAHVARQELCESLLKSHGLSGSDNF